MAPPPPSSTELNFMQGSATAALCWVVYDIFLTFDREVELSVPVQTSWSISKVLFLFSRYHTLLALGCVVGTEHFVIHLNVTGGSRPLPPSFFAVSAPSLYPSSASNISRWYLGMSEILSILAGELMILIRINAVYGWSRRVVLLTLFLFCAVIGFVTTVITIVGGTKGLMGSTGNLTCLPNQANVPDVNIGRTHRMSRCTSMAVACIYIGLILQKATDVIEIEEVENGSNRIRKVSLLAAFRRSNFTPTLTLCLRDAAIYFAVAFGVLLLNLVLITVQNRYAQLGTPWSTRIFLNLKSMSLGHESDTGPTWSEFQRTSSVNFNANTVLRQSLEGGVG
ncbi:hypothetical protein C8J57DRAFT_1277469 [Mycena rebaudengoi]|nr:hypothetical protein C8J57DRAFT_1277469 [Mycena rebaudengoi]